MDKFLYVRERRNIKGMSMGQLAKESGISFMTLSRIENCPEPNCTLLVLRQIAKALDIPMVQLFTEPVVVG